MKIHEKYMRRCIQLAKNAYPSASPNPAVGCVIVHNEKIIGEGYTSTYGGPHAEVNAINSVQDKDSLRSATLYVSLEPCSHFGKTPPCSGLIIKYNVREVIVGMPDPNPLVGGAGIEKLRQAGCKVEVGILEEDCRYLNRRFITFQEENRPYIILKWAESADGFLAPEASLRGPEAEPYWITNKHSRQLVHQWRTEEQAILVGTQTVLEDNPRLNARQWHGKSPVRVVLDRELKIPQNSHVLDKSVRTLILTENHQANKQLEGIEYISIDFGKDVSAEVCRVLHQQKLLSVIVEGGLKTLQNFIGTDLWDEARVFQGIQHFGSGLAAPQISGKIMSQRAIGSDSLKFIQRD